MKKLISQSASFWKNEVVARLLGRCAEVYTTQVESIPEICAEIGHNNVFAMPADSSAIYANPYAVTYGDLMSIGLPMDGRDAGTIEQVMARIERRVYEFEHRDLGRKFEIFIPVERADESLAVIHWGGHTATSLRKLIDIKIASAEDGYGGIFNNTASKLCRIHYYGSDTTSDIWLDDAMVEPLDAIENGSPWVNDQQWAVLVACGGRIDTSKNFTCLFEELCTGHEIIVLRGRQYIKSH